jgi:hypothetical protein
MAGGRPTGLEGRSVAPSGAGTWTPLSCFDGLYWVCKCRKIAFSGAIKAGEPMALRVVSQQSERDIRKKRVHDQLTRGLRRFAANFLRIASGSGKPRELLNQMDKVTASLRAYADAHDGALPHPKVVHDILDSRAALVEHRPWIKEVDEADQCTPECNFRDNQSGDENDRRRSRRPAYATQQRRKRFLRQHPEVGRSQEEAPPKPRVKK